MLVGHFRQLSLIDTFLVLHMIVVIGVLLDIQLDMIVHVYHALPICMLLCIWDAKHAKAPSTLLAIQLQHSVCQLNPMLLQRFHPQTLAQQAIHFPSTATQDFMQDFMNLTMQV